MTSAAIRAGQAFVEMGIDDRRVKPDLAAIGRTIGAWGARIAQIGAGITAASLAGLASLTGITKSFADAGSDLNDMSQRTGASVEALSGLSYAAQLSGAALSDVEPALRKMQQQLALAARGGQGSADALARLGLTVEELQGLSVEEQFLAIGDRIAGLGDESAKTAAIMELFGKGGVALKPLFAEGARGVRELLDEARRLGLVMSGENAQAAAILGDEFDRLHAAVGGLKNSIGAALAPALTTIVKHVNAVVVSVGKWIAANPKLAQGIAVVLATTTALGAALTAVGVALIGVKLAIDAVTVAVAIFKAVAVPELVLLELAIAAVAAAVGFLVVRLASLSGAAETMSSSISAIVALIGQGKIESAWEVVTTSMRLSWLQMIQFVEDGLRGMYREVIRVSAQLAKGLGVPGIDPGKVADFAADPINLDRERRIQQLQGKLAELLKRAAEPLPVAGQPKIPPRVLDQSSLELRDVAGGASSSGGTFSPFAVRGLTGPRVFDRIAENTAETVEAIKDLELKQPLLVEP